jgi:hypothetical protein
MVSDTSITEGGETFYPSWWVDAGSAAHIYALGTTAVSGLTTIPVYKKESNGEWGTNSYNFVITWDKMRTNVAVMDAEKNVTFKAVYTDKDGVQYDNEGNLLFLEATGKFIDYVNKGALTKPNAYTYGTYEVQFTYPDGKKSDVLKVGDVAIDTTNTSLANNESKVVPGGVIVSDKLDPWATSVLGAAFLFENGDGEQLWAVTNGTTTETYNKDSSGNYVWTTRTLKTDSLSKNGVPYFDASPLGNITASSTEAEKGKYLYFLAFDKGNLTYQPVYGFNDDGTAKKINIAGGAVYNGKFITNISKFTSEGAGTLKMGLTAGDAAKKCGAATYWYKTSAKASLSFTDKDGKYSACTIDAVPATSSGSDYKVDFLGTHTFETVTTWMASYTEFQAPSHTQHGYAVVECDCGHYDSGYAANPTDLTTAIPGGKTYKNIIQIPKTTDHVLEMDGSAAKVYTYEANCQHGGFSYNVCKANDNGWVASSDNSYYEYVLTLNKSKSQSAKFRAVVGDTVVGSGGTKKAVTIYNELGDKINAGQTSATVPQAIEWHPIFVSGSLTAKGDHITQITPTKFGTWTHYYTDASGNPQQDNDLSDALKTDDVSWAVSGLPCLVCNTPGISYTYHKRDAVTTGDSPDPLDEGSTDTYTQGDGTIFTKYGAISLSCEDGADCTRQSELTWTVNGLMTTANRPVKTSVTSTKYYGPHTYTNKVNFADNGTATVVQYCTKCGGNTNRVDFEGNKGSQIKNATVTSVENPDGSTTYTATLEGYELTDNTRTVFDLSKATVVINKGEDIDLGTLTKTGNNYYVSQLKTLKMIEVKIGDAVIPRDNYNLTVNDGTVENSALILGNNKITVVPNATNYINKVSVMVNCYESGKVALSSWSIDGVDRNSVDYLKKFEYSGKPHTLVATPMDGSSHATIDATTKYAVLYKPVDDNGADVAGAAWRYVDTDEKAILMSDDTTININKLVFSFDSVDLTQAGHYYVYAQFEAEGFATFKGFVEEVTILKYDTDASLLAKATSVIYGTKDFTVTASKPGVAEMIGLSTEDISTWGVGLYEWSTVLTYDSRNYRVDLSKLPGYVATGGTAGSGKGLQITKRNATIVMSDMTLEYTGKEVDPSTLYTVDGTVNNDTLNVTINTVGNKKLIEPGVYTLVATANDPNYDVEKTTATVTIKANTEDAAAAQKVTDAINKLTASSSEEEVKAARDAYNKLTDTQKASVSKDTLAKLEAAEAAVAGQTTEQKAATAAADTAVTSPTDDNISKAEAAIKAAEAKGQDVTKAKEALAKARTANAGNAATAALQAATAAKNNPTPENIAAAEKAFANANAKTAYMDAAARANMTTATNALADAKKAAAVVKVTFGNSKVQKALNAAGTKTSRISIKKGKKLKLKAKSSNGATITYKAGNKKVTVNAKGVITAKKAGKSKVIVTCGQTKVTVLLKITKK